MMEIGKMTRDLRAALEDDGFGYLDFSSEDTCKALGADWFSHMERTKVVDERGRTLAMCTWGAISVHGDAAITTYGYPDMIEFASPYLDGGESYAMEITDILIALAEKEQPC